MSIFISSSEYLDNLKDFVVPANHRSLGCQNILKKYGDIKYNYFNSGHGIAYCNLECRFNDDVKIQGEENDSYSFLGFNTAATATMYYKVSNEKELCFESNRCFYGSINAGHKSFGTYCKNKRYHTHFITIDNSFLANLHPVKKQNKIFCSDTFCIELRQNINAYQSMILNDIAHAKFLTASLHELFIESKVLELTHNFFSAQSNYHFEDLTYKFTQSDIASIEKAKSLLLENMKNPPSLKVLAQKAAINEFKLKNGFKALYKNTVFGYLQEYRLNEAKALLLRNDINVNEAAKLVGYNNVSHFTKIFKAKYGINPKELKVKKSYYVF